MGSERDLGPDEERGLRWLTQPCAPEVCAMLATGPMSRERIATAIRMAVARIDVESTYPTDATLDESLQRLVDFGYVVVENDQFRLTARGSSVAWVVGGVVVLELGQ
ncbi:MAG: hypothetical protein GEU86_16190 [Actinophytocola sp.]|nr:hypothetical protein [Actinophytocola sp.]